MQENKQYGTYILEFFEDNGAVGMRNRLTIYKDTLPQIANVIRVITKQLNNNMLNVLLPIVNITPAPELELH